METVKVVIRTRPLNQRETKLKCCDLVKINKQLNQCVLLNKKSIGASKRFSYDAVYDKQDDTNVIYCEIAGEIVNSVLDGYNGTIFAYGQTGCGKSFTMQGPLDDDDNIGVIPRSFYHIFETIALGKDIKYLVHVSFLEIYNEEIRDLLNYDPNVKLEMKEHTSKGVYVAGLSLHKVTSVTECQKIMQMGWKNRATGSTLMNLDSSRSHSVFTITIEMIQNDNSAKGEHIRVGKLNLVDLAGSERQSKSGASGDRLREAAKINLSLSALGNVISALVDPNTKHIPYRDSKLTRLLQDSLGGNTKTLMIACISPADNNYDETLSTLRYANRAKEIKNKPVINEDPKDAMLREYQDEIKRLRQLLQGQNIDNLPEPNFQSLQHMRAEQTRVRQEYEDRLTKLKQKFNDEVANKAKLVEEVEKVRSVYEDKFKDLQEKTSLLRGNESSWIVNKEGGVTPADKDFDHMSKEELIKRLQSLQSDFVGGESTGDALIQLRHKERIKSFEAMRNKLRQANKDPNAEEGQVIITIFENIQDELGHKNAELEEANNLVENLKQDNKDIENEFQRERESYLDHIRKQSKTILLLQSILDKVQPCIRRDCNYYSIESIKKMAKYDEDQNRFILPELKIEPTNLPNVLNGAADRRMTAPPLGDGQASLVFKMASSTMGTDYFGKKNSKLLNARPRAAQGKRESNTSQEEQQYEEDWE
ncbi:Kinesin-like protein kif17 [Cichlidogyrus casuarinus]|uniref:Kinesin-like protein n=1 Tax=Cichlidogyrus casuarinus TaxID=1844966 RepID=A0ABD2QA17_9PLAT